MQVTINTKVETEKQKFPCLMTNNDFIVIAINEKDAITIATIDPSAEYLIGKKSNYYPTCFRLFDGTVTLGPNVRLGPNQIK